MSTVLLLVILVVAVLLIRRLTEERIACNTRLRSRKVSEAQHN
jgi:hypothetical protein